MVTSPDIEEASVVQRLVDQARSEMLPLWGTVGWDARNGGFVEQLRSDGVADADAPRRVLVQARQIYCFGKAAQFGWYPNAKELALRGLEYLLKHAKAPEHEGSYVHSLSPDGSVYDSRVNTYNHAFILLALATVLQLDGDAQIRAEINRTLAFLDTKLKSSDGGYIEELPPVLPRRQNPHMHLFESMIALFDSTGEAVFQNRAGEFFSLLIANLYDPQTQTLSEYFENDWSRINPPVVEPGHQAEWVWLLKGFERITGCPTARHRNLLMESTLRYALPNGFLPDEGDTQGAVVRSTRRCWPQTELAKAWIAQVEGGDESARPHAYAALANLERGYLTHSIAGGWYDQFDSSGTSLVETIPASTFYHIFCAISEAKQVLT